MRNRIVFTIIVAFFSLTVSHAQLLRGYGFKVGAVASSQNWDTQDYTMTNDYRWDVDVSAYLELIDVPVFSLVTELQYSRRGSILNVILTEEANRPYYSFFVDRYDYLCIPILAKIRFSTSFIDPYLIVGPRFDFLLSTHQDKFADNRHMTMASSEHGLTVGIGAELKPLYIPVLLLEIRYNSAFTDSFADRYFRIRSHSFDCLLGVRL
jgi:hypothetical protein